MDLGGFRTSKSVILIPVLMLLAFIIACGGTATSAPDAAREAPTPTLFVKVVESEGDLKQATPVKGSAATPVPAVKGSAATPVPDATKESAPAMQIKRGGIVPMHAYAAPTTARPLIEATYSHIHMLSPYFNGLLIYDPETADTDDLTCDLCTSWDVSADGTVFTYRLHPEARWSDGVPVTSEDVVFTFNSIFDPDQYDPLWEGHKLRSETGFLKPYYESIRAIDDKTVEITLQFAAGDWHPTLGLQTMKTLPKHVVLGEGKMQGLAKPEDIVGSGPFIHVEFVKDVSNETTRNPDYFKEGRPYIDGMIQYIIVDVGSIVAAFAAEQVLMTSGNVDNMGSIESKQFLEDHGDRYNVYFVGPAGAYHVMFNAEKKPFDDPRVRKAINLAVNRQEIIEIFSVGDYTLGLPFPPGTWYGRTLEEAEQVPGFRLDANGNKHPDDLAEARRLLTEAGFPDGFKTTITMRRAVLYVDIGTVVAQQLEEYLNIESEINIMESAAGQAAYLAGDYEYAVQGHALAFSSPDAGFGSTKTTGSLLGDTWARGQKTTHWAEIQELFTKQTRETDVVKRLAMLRQVSDLWLDDPPMADIYWSSSTFNIHKKIQGWNPHPSIHASSMMHEHIWCDPAC